MTDNPSHPSWPHPGTGKRRAAAPRTAHDYELLATLLACPNLFEGEVSVSQGFEEDYAERLLGSAPGQAFANWFLRQPRDFIDRFRLPADRELEARMEAERKKLRLISKDPEIRNDVLKELGFGVQDKED